MRIDLKDPTSFTLENVRKLIASADGSVDRQLRVTEDGIAFLSLDIGIKNRNGIRFSLGTFDRGEGATGVSAAQDDKRVQQVFKALQVNWPEPEFESIEEYDHY